MTVAQVGLPATVIIITLYCTVFLPKTPQARTAVRETTMILSSCHGTCVCLKSPFQVHRHTNDHFHIQTCLPFRQVKAPAASYRCVHTNDVLSIYTMRYCEASKYRHCVTYGPHPHTSTWQFLQVKAAAYSRCVCTQHMYLNYSNASSYYYM